MATARCGDTETARHTWGWQLLADLVRDMVEVLTSFCARLFGRGSARNRAIKALGCAQRNIGPKLVGAAGEDEQHE